MVLEEKKIKNICNFYVSDYHLEIMLLPYISKKIDNEEEVVILTERDLTETLKIVIEKTNLEQKKKKKIMKLEWNTQKTSNINENSNVIIIGNIKFINDKILELKEKNLEKIVCYDYNEVKDNMKEIVSEYDGVLNSLGINNI